MIHKIKALHDDGQGLSIRAIGQELGISRNTVRKYLRQDVATIETAQSNREREKKLDAHRDYIVYLLRTFPKLSSVKVARKLREKVGELAVSERTLRRYVQQVKSTVASRQRRYYEPVLDMVPGVQCQVDPGELREVMIDGEPRPLYFVVFVLSYSRLSYVGVSLSPLDTATFIRLHDEAFRYFGGLPEECVYDQTKMVVISEQFRELEVNQRFHEYATTAGFRIRACCGYDPESKGKVEAGVKYAKQDAFYGEVFRDEADLRAYLRQWLDDVANVRTHGTTGQQPRALCDAEERRHLRPYLTPACVGREDDGLAPRRVDKTGLIAWKANKYSVPMAYQQGRVGVQEAGDRLTVHDLESGDEIAAHTLHLGKGRTLRNSDHYRDHRQQEADLEQAIAQCLGETLGQQLCARLRDSMPHHYKDQLRGARKVLEGEPDLDLALVSDWVTRERLTARRLKERLAAARLAKARGRDHDADVPASPGTTPAELAPYAQLGRSGCQQEVTHGAA
ncbi:IS21 family transposase [Halomonas chromatireducens]|uniref:Integrase core domain protein n=1 Tax=Halomonas chromatireducens TaxID=507626 RepID=A0A120JWF9_9GAMM|nr:IS21 family transposase [Halomonas chromatireducens]AMD01837.1 Integrase core domain protein [Halomonas chromatireducens]